MPVIALANSKGGVGKTTLALVLSQVISRTSSVTLIDADPNQPLSAWASINPDLVPDNLTLIPSVNEDTVTAIIDEEEARSDNVIIDLEGSKNETVSLAISRADLVLIPMQGSQLDAAQAAKVCQLIARVGRDHRRTIPFAVVYTRTSSTIRTKEFKYIDKQLREQGIPVLPIELVERAAFRSINLYGGTLYDLDKDQVRNPNVAIHNAEKLAEAVYNIILKASEAA